MSKIQEHYEDAERSYIQESMTYAEIAQRFGISERTVRNWSESGNWPERKKTFMAGRASLDEKLNQFVNKLMDTIMADWDSGKQVDPGRMYAFNQLLGKLEKVRKYENQQSQAQAAAAEQAAATQATDPEELAARVRSALGLN